MIDSLRSAWRAPQVITAIVGALLLASSGNAQVFTKPPEKQSPIKRPIPASAMPRNSDGLSVDDNATNAAADAATKAAFDSGIEVPIRRVIGVLTSNGLGLYRIGTSFPELMDAGVALTSGPNDYSCAPFFEAHFTRDPSVTLLFNDDTLVRISAKVGSRIATDRGIGLGASEAQLRTAYGAGLEVEQHASEKSPAKYLTTLPRQGTNGIRFETGTDRRVARIHAGDASIQHFEACE